MLGWKDFGSLNAAYSATLTEECALNINRTQRTKFCKNCRRNDHDTAHCRSKPFHQSRPIHTVQNDKFCNHCKDKGHVINECRKRQYNNNKRNAQNTNNNKQNSERNTKTLHLNSHESTVTNTPLAARIANLAVFEN